MAGKPAAKREAPPAAATPLTEWITAGLGLILVLFALGVVLASALAPRTLPSLQARIVSAVPSTAGWLAEVEVSNAGSETAAGVEVEGVLGPDTARATLDYVPGHGQATAVLVFPADPRGRAQVRIRGWSEP